MAKCKYCGGEDGHHEDYCPTVYFDSSNLCKLWNTGYSDAKSGRPKASEEFYYSLGYRAGINHDD